ncbi:MAG TPA: hypothetical protein DCM61_04010 [Clostridiales bacterium]|nr:hypothetical protein [Clostridiales bacterium]
MNGKNKKAAQVLQHQDGEGKQLTMPSVRLPEKKHSMGGTEKQGSITSLLPSGAERAVSLRRLAEITGLSEREVRRSIQRERMNGAAICEAGAGYFLAETDEERRRWVRSMRGRARQILRAARAVERGCDTIE